MEPPGPRYTAPGHHNAVTRSTRPTQHHRGEQLEHPDNRHLALPQHRFQHAAPYVRHYPDEHHRHQHGTIPAMIRGTDVVRHNSPVRPVKPSGNRLPRNAFRNLDDRVGNTCGRHRTRPPQGAVIMRRTSGRAAASSSGRHCCAARPFDPPRGDLVDRADQHRHDLAVVPPQPLGAGIGVPVQHLDGERVDAGTP